MSEATFGVHSETGVLRQVIVCRPGLAHRRLTPSNCDALLFDDVFWVKQAQKDHDLFVEVMRGRGVEVLDVNDLLAQTLDIPAARKWLLDLRITRNDIIRYRLWEELAPYGHKTLYTGTNIPDYPTLAQLWWQNIGDAMSGAKTPQEALDSLCAEQEKVHTMLVVGRRDLEAGAVSVRVHGKGNLGAKPRAEVVADLIAAARERRG